MGKKVKTGKARRDKFYHLAKETGYRSRSAFKLIQLNRKFQFLQRARALIDLCAAPGGWLQVASKFMPVSSLIIGVDLVPIKPIPSVVTLQEDITTEKCRQALRKELQTWKVDVVLNDGAPNVGANWLHDAFSQAQLTLMALKLASEFLARGGWFITKVFRSRDYQPLLWVLRQLFRSVHSTKPQASRHESAEIFVVCQGYTAPDKIDSKFFDPKHAFKDVEVQAKSVRDLVSSKKPKAEGYSEGDYTLYHHFTLTEFLRAQNPVDFLDKASEITFDNPELENHPDTTPEIRECCRDIRVLGRKELRSLLNWRRGLRRFLARQLRGRAKELDLTLDSCEESGGEAEKEARGPEPEEEEQLEQQLADLKAEELAVLKRKKRKVLRDLRRKRERAEMKMDLPGESVADGGDVCLFSLKPIGGAKLKELARGDMAAADEMLAEGGLHADPDLEGLPPPEEEDEQLAPDDVSLASGLSESELEEVEERQRELEGRRAASLGRRKRPRREDPAPAPEGDGNPLVVHLETPDQRREQQTDQWFSKDVFAGLETEGDEQLEIQQTAHLCRRQTEENQPSELETERELEQKGQQPGPRQGEAVDVKEDSEDETSSDESDIQQMKNAVGPNRRAPADEDDEFEVVPVKKCDRVLDPEGLALGTAIATSRKRARDLVDDSFNRYAFEDPEGTLPDWFVDNEHRYRQRPAPFDPAMAAEFRRRWAEINARPIKKVAEAKARKKRRFLKKMEQLKRKAEAVVNTVDISEREKMAQMRSIYKKAGLGREKREVTYVVSKKGAARRSGRPAGVKGKYRMVDPRMKKDSRPGGKEAGGKRKGRK
ncbi:pre-rRNA 2'-O-ribose RNA methyltransferase FTSJ3 [Mobula hypostoma]|uniref:pre-rRNA 2'-O-ribose RNA methyltransferase FTSJ3 n=2 Tax=Mobula TaxID=86365 RepID=UPI002FC3AFCF